MAYGNIFSTETSFYDAAEEAKDSFYDDLQDAVGRVPAGNMLVIAGDWNARPGPVDAAT